VSRRPELECAEGFSVESEEPGRTGCVAAVVPHATAAGGILLVHTGGHVCTLASVPFDDVESVDVGGRRIVLRTGGTREPERSRRRTRAATSVARRAAVPNSG
jgi:hypothetical protein